MNNDMVSTLLKEFTLYGTYSCILRIGEIQCIFGNYIYSVHVCDTSLLARSPIMGPILILTFLYILF